MPIIRSIYCENKNGMECMTERPFKVLSKSKTAVHRETNKLFFLRIYLQHQHKCEENKLNFFTRPVPIVLEYVEQRPGYDIGYFLNYISYIPLYK